MGSDQQLKLLWRKLNKQKEYKYRFVIFPVYALAALVNSLPVNTFASLSSTIEKTFNIGIVEISLNTLFFPIAHTLFSFFCNWLINKKGMKISFFVAAFLNVTGVWLRTFLKPGEPYICLLGSLLSAIGAIFLLNTPSKMALNWFRSEQVPMITFSGVLINLISMVLSVALPGMFISSKSTQDDIIRFLRMEAIIVTIPFLLLVIFFREKPPLPPSKAALAFNNTQKGNYIDIIKKLFTNVGYLKLCLAMALNYGICIGFIAVLEQVLVGIGYENASQAISVSGSGGIIFGVIANLLYLYLLKKTKQFKKIIVFVTFGDFVGLLIWGLGFLEALSKWWQLILISCFFCFNHFSIPSIYILYSTQTAFPVDQASAAGYLMAISQTFGFLAGVLFSSLLDGTIEMSRVILFSTIGCIFISSLITLTIKEDLRKTKFESGATLQVNSADEIDGKQSLISEN